MTVIDQILAVASGQHDSPAPDDAPAALRWQWYARLYTDPTWGLSANVAGFPSAFAATIAHSCQALTRVGDQALLAEQWRLLGRLADIHRRAAHDPAVVQAYFAVSFTAFDADDYLRGHTFGGVEAVVSAFLALKAGQPPSVARACIDAAFTSWHNMTIDINTWKAAA